MKERDDSKPLSSIIQLDEVYWGGEQQGGKRGRVSSNKTPFVAAVSVNEKGASDCHEYEYSQWFPLQRNRDVDQAPSSRVVSDGLACFAAVTESGCQRFVTGGGPEGVSLEAFTWVNTMISNVKRSMNGAYHAINHKHLPRYLAEFCYRFNQRFALEEMPPMSMRLLNKAEFHG